MLSHRNQFEPRIPRDVYFSAEFLKLFSARFNPFVTFDARGYPNCKTVHAMHFGTASIIFSATNISCLSLDLSAAIALVTFSSNLAIGVSTSYLELRVSLPSLFWKFSRSFSVSFPFGSWHCLQPVRISFTLAAHAPEL